MVKKLSRETLNLGEIHFNKGSLQKNLFDIFIVRASYMWKNNNRKFRLQIEFFEVFLTSKWENIFFSQSTNMV